MKLTKGNLAGIKGPVKIPRQELFNLPEKILQFGTGVLLRGLCDYFVHDANTKGIFNGRIVVVKSTGSGTTDAFSEQDNLYTICVRGLDNGKIIEEDIICTAISRVLSAKQEWNEILQTVHNPELQVIISNTTEVGLQLVKEKVLDTVPASFPGKLLAVLYERYRHLRNEGLVVIPTELLSDNGEILRGIINELIAFNNLDEEFKKWLDEKVVFCNSLVDRIVTKDPGEELLTGIQNQLGYHDELLTMCEDYRLWAIEGNAEVEKILSFASTGEGAFVKPDIDIFKFLKLHLLNGTHTLSASLAFLSGFEFVKQGMDDKLFSSYVENLMLNDIAKAIPYDIPGSEIKSFSSKVLDRFRNPFLEHKWINITLQNSMKMKNRNVPVLKKYNELYGASPGYMATGFAGYLLFMKPAKQEGNQFYGKRGNDFYPINDEQAAYFSQVWSNSGSVGKLVNNVLSNSALWGTDLSRFTPFAESVEKKLSSMIDNGVLYTIKNI
ncbi:MAG: tagaturonate reductase [Chitinophagaceae bacterium]|nr:tagaturonate reductase [Chitinophagaceae bacterium]